MSYFIPAGAGQVIHVLQLTGDPEPMTVQFAVDGIGDDSELAVQSLVDNMHDAFGDTLMLWISDQYKLVRTELRYHGTGDLPTDDFRIAVATGDRVGGRIEAPAPQNVAYLIHKRTARAGRTGRGRVFLPGVLEGAVDAAGAVVASSTRTGIQSQLINYKGRYGFDALADVGLVLLHGWDGEDDPLFPTPITSLTLDDRVATQRTRLRR